MRPEERRAHSRSSPPGQERRAHSRSSPGRTAGRHEYIRVATARAVHGSGQWVGDAGWVRRFGADDRPTREEFRQRPMALAAPEEFGAASVQADLMTFGQLRAYIGRLGDS